MMKIYCNVCNKFRNLKIVKYIFKSIFYSKCGHEYIKIFKEEDSLEIL